LKDPAQETTHTVEIQQAHKDGRLIWVEVNIRYHLNDENEVEVIGVSRNIESRKRTETDILYLSYHDKLTGVYNRSFYEEELNRLNTDRNLPFTIILSDINGLKLTNDAFGHMAGDRLIIAYAEILKRICRKDDIVARIGGDEFAILLPKTTETVANLLVNRLNEAILNTKPDKIKLSVSFGLRTKDRLDEDFEDVFKEAEDRMYHEKINNQVHFKSSILQLITTSLFEKYPDEREHAAMVSNQCRQMGEALSLSTKEVSDLELAGLLHDIGKIGLDGLGHHYPDFDMTPEFKRHCEIGYQITRSVYEFSHIAEFIYAHHERYDGTGYPNGTKGKDIPLQARIIKIANDFSSAKQRDKLAHHEAIEFIKNASGTFYDPILVDVFIKLFAPQE
jgi:diguanylate cyclase (GGDEF)-like protein/putative nucleotidyltransferase with HDIG domain